MTAELFKILGIIIIVCVVSLLLKDLRPEFSMLLVLITCVAVLMIIILFLNPYIQRIRELLSKLGESSKYFAIAFKALGISYITGFVSDSCRDFGQTSLAAKAELAGKITIFALSFPLLSGIVETVINYARI